MEEVRTEEEEGPVGVGRGSSIAICESAIGQASSDALVGGKERKRGKSYRGGDVCTGWRKRWDVAATDVSGCCDLPGSNVSLATDEMGCPRQQHRSQNVPPLSLRVYIMDPERDENLWTLSLSPIHPSISAPP